MGAYSVIVTLFVVYESSMAMKSFRDLMARRPIVSLKVFYAFMEKFFPYQATLLVLRGVSRIVDNRPLIVQDNQGTDYSWNPSTARQDHHNQERAAALVHHSQWGKDD